MQHDARHRLETVLSKEIDAAQVLAKLLDDERAALTGDSPEAVRAKAADKLRLFADLESLDAERRALWDDADAAGSLAGAGTTAERWRALLNVMAQCKTANEINGHIINIRQNQVRQLFDIVRGGAPATYGPQGKSLSSSPRALARA